MASTTRALRVWAAAATIMTILVLAASSGTVRLWTEPEVDVDVGEPVTDTGSGGLVTPPDRDVNVGRLPSWIGAVVEVIVVTLVLVLVVALVVGAVVAAGQLSWRAPIGRLQRRLLPSRSMPEPLPDVPDVPETVLDVDVASALAALSGGEPRNAIVACWMQLEQDAASMGFARLESETSSEYVARVVTAASVDSGPITELAALYREARFSMHDLGDAHRARAAHVLHRVVAALRTSTEVRA